MLDCHEILYRLHQVIILKNDNNFDHLLKTTMINIFELYISNNCEIDVKGIELLPESASPLRLTELYTLRQTKLSN